MSKIYDALRKSQAERGAPPRDPSGKDREDGPETPPREPPGPPPPAPSSGRPGDERPAVAWPSLAGRPRRFRAAVERVSAAVQNGPTPRVVVFTGATSGVGTSTLVAATAATLVQDPGVSVLVIDAHARPGEGSPFPEVGSGLIQLVSESVPLTRCVFDTDQPGLRYLPRGAGSYNGPKLAERLIALLPALRSAYDYLLLDAPPVVSAPETGQLAAAADGAVVVLAAERTPKAEAQRTRDALERHGAVILGSIINGVRRLALPGTP